MANAFSARQDDALTALVELRSYGVSVEEILNVREFLNRASLESARGIGTHNHFDSYLFNSYDLNTTKNGSKTKSKKNLISNLSTITINLGLIY